MTTHSHGRATMTGPARDVLAEQQNLSRRRKDSCYQVEQRGLACPKRGRGGQDPPSPNRVPSPEGMSHEW